MAETTERDTAIETVEEFLAHALALETEAAEGYEEVGDSMAVHNNPEVAELFHRFARNGRKHAEQVRALAEGMTLPKIAPWDFKWGEHASPETSSRDRVHYLMTSAQALALALRAERSAHAFYAGVAESSPNAKVRKIAAEFAEEEADHVRMLTEWIEAHPAPHRDWDEDLDPLAMPE